MPSVLMLDGKSYIGSHLRTYVTTKEICQVILALIKSESVPITSNYPSKTVETKFIG